MMIMWIMKFKRTISMSKIEAKQVPHINFYQRLNLKNICHWWISLVIPFWSNLFDHYQISNLETFLSVMINGQNHHINKLEREKCKSSLMLLCFQGSLPSRMYDCREILIPLITAGLVEIKLHVCPWLQSDQSLGSLEIDTTFHLRHKKSLTFMHWSWGQLCNCIQVCGRVLQSLNWMP